MAIQQYKPLSGFKNFTDFFSALASKSHPFFAAAHRGICGNVPENSIKAFQECFRQNVYIIEIDIQRSKDGHLIVMHDITVNRMTNSEGRISELTLEQLQKLFLKEKSGGIGAKLTNEKIPTLKEVLLLAKGRALLNLDKAWEYREEIYDLVEETGTFDHVLLKSGEPIAKVAAFLHSKPKPLHYMHKLQDRNLQELDDLITRISPLAIEILFAYETDEVVSKPVLAKMRSASNVWVNALDNGENAHHTDSMSLLEPDKGWGWLLDQNMNIIQTDYAAEIMEYAERWKSKA